ncbi:MAG: hypothetical protein QOJ58_362 [Alphaproteobacteria bacterium]|jgi:hypothetical protein|nr:hypothetical protein [Alphaproteobacteria bacterium]
MLERAKGIEPSYAAWEAGCFPYSSISYLQNSAINVAIISMHCIRSAKRIGAPRREWPMEAGPDVSAALW